MDYFAEICGHTLEYFDEEHLYVVDGITVPSITQVISEVMGKRYDTVAPAVLAEAARKGTELHNAIERYCEYGEESDLPEVRNFKFLAEKYQFEVVSNELPIIICKGRQPIAAGRMDLLLMEYGSLGIADIKRTYKLDKNYLALQLNLYRIGYEQTYGKGISFLRGIHLREDVRKYVRIPINEEYAWEALDKYMEAHNA